MISKIIFLKPILFSLSILLLISSYANTNQLTEKPAELPRSEIFPPEDGKLIPLQGKIINGRYYAPKRVFSCQAYDFGEGKYISQDRQLDDVAYVGFYSVMANFKEAKVIFMPGLEEKNLDRKALEDVFDCLGFGLLKDLDAKSIKILSEEMVGDNMLFVTLSIEKMPVLRAPNGKYMSSTRGYLAFQDKDKIVLLSNQKVTLPGKKHTPKKHIKKLKNDILEFRKTFEFGPIPAIKEPEMRLAL